MNLPLNFAVVGCGALAQGQHIPNIANLKRANLHTLCDVNEQALEKLKQQYPGVQISTDFNATINNPDIHAICLATTEKLRLPVIRAAAEAGKPIYVEKPLASTLEEMYEIQKVVHDSSIPFCVGHNRRSSPAMIDAHQIFRSHMTSPTPQPWRWNREGDNRPALPEDGKAAINVRINDDWWSWKAWVFDKTHNAYGPMLFEMVHFTDICNWFLAAEPAEVVALESGMLNHGVVIKYKTGELANIFMSANGTFGYPKELYEVFGNGAAVSIDHMVEIRTAGIEGAPTRKTYPMLNDHHADVTTEHGGITDWLAKKAKACQDAIATGDPMKQFTAEPDKGHAHQIDRFIDQILGNGPEVCGVDDSIMATRVAFAAVTAAREGRVVKIEEV